MNSANSFIVIILLQFYSFQGLSQLTGEFHKKHINEFMFSSQPIIVGKEDPAQFTTKFKATDNIYGVYYFDSGCADWGADDMIYIDIDVNGTPSQWDTYVDMCPLIRVNQSYMMIEIIPEPSRALQQTATLWSDKIFTQMKSGVNTISFRFWGRSKTINISDWNDYDYYDIKENAKRAVKEAKINAIANTVLPNDFYVFSKNPFSDELLKEDLLKKYFEVGCNNQVSQVLKIAYPNSIGEDWYLEKNDHSFPLHKRTSPIGFLFKNKDGNCYFIYVPIIRPYLGKGKYGYPQVIIKQDNKSEIVQITCNKFYKT